MKTLLYLVIGLGVYLIITRRNSAPMPMVTGPAAPAPAPSAGDIMGTPYEGYDRSYTGRPMPKTLVY